MVRYTAVKMIYAVVYLFLVNTVRMVLLFYTNYLR